ncbi:hypothetical protein C1H46_043341 [Malus baccata]|uniref:Major facilitator superfamily (MFS) profile domain-containing protein n=1 Tax=Malus baccata TaxID=106549 RepID=A0A540KA83_MALBA|nr:hypothetical protein C1H46_043341 [Malus baccata]
MAIGECRDVESGEGNNLGDLDVKQPLVIKKDKIFAREDGDQGNDKSGSIGMVLVSTFVAVCGSFEFGSCVGYSAPTQSAIREDLNLSLAQFSMFGSILTIGGMLGAVTSGRTADFLGRKGAMRMSASFCITGWLAIYFSKGALSLDVGRFFTGFGIGVFSYVVPIFIAEIAPKNLRGGLTTLNQLMIVTGSSVSFVIGTIISWETLALTGIIPCIFLLVGLCFVPESPRWLAKIGREKEFQVALQRLRGKDADISDEMDEIQEYIATLQSLPKANMLDLFQSKYIRAVIIGVGLMVFQQFGGINGIGFYASQTFEEAGISSKIGTIAYACVPITVVGAALIDKSGRRPLIMVSATGTFLGCFLAGTSFFLKGNGLLLDWVPIIAVSGVLIYIASFSLGMGAVPWVIMSEVFPIHVKGAAGSLVVLVNWLGAWAVSYTYNFLMSWSSSTKGVSSSFSVLVKRGVIRSFDVLTSCDALSPILKERLGRFLSGRKFEISKEVQQACRPGDFVSLNSSCMETPLPLTEWQPKCSHVDRFGTKLAETKVMISDDAAPSHSPLVVAREGQVHDIDNLIHNLGEAIKNSNPMALHTLEELLLLFVSFDGQGPESGFILPDVLSSIMKMLYELNSPENGDEVGSATTLIIRMFVLSKHQNMQAMLLFWLKNGFPVGARLLSYASRLAYEAHMVGFFGGAIVDVNAITPSESGIHLLLYHVNGYFSFLHGRTENSYETIESISKAEKKLVAMLVDGAFAAYKCFLVYSRTALFKDAENSLPRLLFSNIMTCSVWERKRLKFLFSSVYSHLSDMSIGEDGIIKLLVGQLDHADLVNIQIEIGLK